MNTTNGLRFLQKQNNSHDFATACLKTEAAVRRLPQGVVDLTAALR
ncbi:hypothetical protein [Pararhizobium arenae]|nr:hypothetical protein [Pararhizobium arenae]